MPPGVDKPLPEAGDSRDAAGDKDRPATSEPGVERNREPATDYRTAEIWGRVYQAGQPVGRGVLFMETKLFLVE